MHVFFPGGLADHVPFQNGLMAVGSTQPAVHPGTLAGAAAASALWAPAWLEMWRLGLCLGGNFFVDFFGGDKTRKMLQIREDFSGFFLCVFSWVC